MNCLINIVLVLHCSNFLSDDCLKLVYCSMVFVNCIDLHTSALLHTFVLPLRLELKSKAQNLTQGKRSRFFMKIREIHMPFLGKNQENSGKKKQKFCLNPVKTQLNHLASLAKWLSVPLRTKWLWVRVPMQSLKQSLFWYFLVLFCCSVVLLFRAIPIVPLMFHCSSGVPPLFW